MVCPSRCQRGHPPHTNVRGRTRFRPTWSSRAHRPSSGTDLLAIRVRSFWRFRTLTPRSFRSARTAVALKAIARQGGRPGRGASRLQFAFQDQRAMFGFFLILAANSTSRLIASATRSVFLASQVATVTSTRIVATPIIIRSGNVPTRPQRLGLEMQEKLAREAGAAEPVDSVK